MYNLKIFLSETARFILAILLVIIELIALATLLIIFAFAVGFLIILFFGM